jgi:hypothetical protein
MKNTLKPLPSFEVGTPRTDAQSQLDAKRYHGHSRDYVSLKIFTKQLELELAEILSSGISNRTMNHNTSAQCHTENGEVFMTDQSGNGHHLKRNKMKKLSETPKAYITIDREETILFADILKAAPTPPTTEFKRALRAYRDFIIKHKQ